MKLCVIPARGGSKRVPRKNIKAFCGLPMIAWSIRAALESQLFDQVIVSTEDEEIAGVARDYGATTPFMRPLALADDHAGTGVVVSHAINWFVEQGTSVDLTCCLYATAPFVQAKDLKAAYAEQQSTQAAFVFTATRFDFPIMRAIAYDGGGNLGPVFPEHIHKRSQDLPEAFHDAGQFYLGDARHWLAGTPMFGPQSRMLLLPRHRVQDIDTPEDWERAEWLFQAMQAQTQ